jgi:putative hydrolase of HD superfamily
MNNNIANVMHFYALCNKLKDTLRKGVLTWNAQRERIESVAEHIYGVQILAIAIYYQFGYKLDLNKIIYMLAIHELEEIEIGDLAFYEIADDEKLKEGKRATDCLLKDLIGKEEISDLLDEFNERKTEEAKYAYHCDKLECILQVKKYEQEGSININNQSNNPIINTPDIKQLANNEKNVTNIWIEFDRSKFEDDPVFINIINWLKNNNI